MKKKGKEMNDTRREERSCARFSQIDFKQNENEFAKFCEGVFDFWLGGENEPKSPLWPFGSSGLSLFLSRSDRPREPHRIVRPPLDPRDFCV